MLFYRQIKKTKKKDGKKMKKYRLNKKGKRNLGLLLLFLKNVGIVAIMVLVYLFLGILVTVVETI